MQNDYGDGLVMFQRISYCNIIRGPYYDSHKYVLIDSDFTLSFIVHNNRREDIVLALISIYDNKRYNVPRNIALYYLTASYLMTTRNMLSMADTDAAMKIEMNMPGYCKKYLPCIKRKLLALQWSGKIK